MDGDNISSVLSEESKKAPSAIGRPRIRNNTTTTVTAVGSPLTDPEGVKNGYYSYSDTNGTMMDDLREKGIAQLIAERRAQGVPTGAYTQRVVPAKETAPKEQ